MRYVVSSSWGRWWVQDRQGQSLREKYRLIGHETTNLGFRDKAEAQERADGLNQGEE